MRLVRGVDRAESRLIAKADAARDEGRLGDAAALYQEALRLAPSLGHIHVQAGHMLKEIGELGRAESHYGEALKLMPDDADLALQLGHFHKLSGRLDKAYEFYTRAARLAPTSEDAWSELQAMGLRNRGALQARPKAVLDQRWRVPLVFLHIPKTGGTSLAHAISANFPTHLVFSDDDGNISSGLLEKIGAKLHGTCFIHGHSAHGLLNKFGHSRLFTVLRNPKTQAISNYLHLRRDPELDHHRDACETEFTEFVHIHWKYLAFQAVSLDVVQSITSIDSVNTFFQRLPSTKTFMNRLDFVGCLEEIDVLIRRLSSAYGWQTPPAAPHLNTAASAGVDPGEAARLSEAYDALWQDPFCAPLLAAEHDLYEQARRLSHRQTFWWSEFARSFRRPWA